MLNGLLTVVLFSLSCIFCDAMLCMYDFMLSVLSLKEKENEFQLFLFLRKGFLQEVH
jgi:hypothetical protein